MNVKVISWAESKHVWFTYIFFYNFRISFEEVITETTQIRLLTLSEVKKTVVTT